VKRYTPRRANKQRWLQDAPDYILDCFDSKRPGERYTVLFCGELLVVYPEGQVPTRSNTYIAYLGMDDSPTHPQGISMWGEMAAHEAAAYRYRVGHQRVRWLDLPEHIRKHVVARAT
jgi:hypothetical protein